MNRLGMAPRSPSNACGARCSTTAVPGKSIYEPFLGSGTTLIAAESVGRICIAIEINPLYVDVAVRRWQRFTGKQATLELSGQTFDATAAQRLDATSP